MYDKNMVLHELVKIYIKYNLVLYEYIKLSKFKKFCSNYANNDIKYRIFILAYPDRYEYLYVVRCAMK